MSNAPKNRRACVLISNDDGIAAPGLRELVAQLAADGGIDVHVCAPSGERSAQSHAITLGRYLSCFAAEVPGAVSAFAVDGTPADSVMLALHSPLFQVRLATSGNHCSRERAAYSGVQCRVCSHSPAVPSTHRAL
jgi:5'/3'-nucleotidase SurE